MPLPPMMPRTALVMDTCRLMSRFLTLRRRQCCTGVFRRKNAFVVLANNLEELRADRLEIDVWVGHFDPNLINLAAAHAVGLPLLGKALRRSDRRQHRRR